MRPFRASALVSFEVHAIALVLATWPAPSSPPSPSSAPVSTLGAVLVDVEREPELKASAFGVRASSTHPGEPTPHPVAKAPPGRPPPPSAQAGAVLVDGAPLPSASAVVTDSAPVFPGGTTEAGSWLTEPQEDPLARAWGLLDGKGRGGAGGWGDRSRPARLGGTKHWPCSLPFGVDFDHAVAQVVADVDARGHALRVEVVDDPHHLVDAAIPCAMRETFVAALDVNGRPTRGRTAPFRVVFDR